LRNGLWSDTEICQPIKCGSFPLPEFARVSSCSTYYNQTCDFTCNPGFKLNGLNSAICQANGSWSPMGKCQPLDCGDFTLPKFATRSHCLSSNYNQTCNFTCNPGYQLEGLNWATCQEDASWSKIGICEKEVENQQDGSTTSIIIILLVVVLFVVLGVGFWAYKRRHADPDQQQLLID